ncbi:Uncharacterised protein [Vibrio cholerae]|nr:Uncharacterised protein [Vibrio cholerae]
MILSMSNPFNGRVSTHWPSRKMVISSQIEKISSILCEMYTTPQPFSLSFLMMVKRWFTSFSVRDEVGSSMITTLAS